MTTTRPTRPISNFPPLNENGIQHTWDVYLEDGVFWAVCSALPGASAAADTREELYRQISVLSDGKRWVAMGPLEQGLRVNHAKDELGTSGECDLPRQVRMRLVEDD